MDEKLNLDRSAGADENRMRVGTPDGYIQIAGSDKFMSLIFQAIRESATLAQIVRKGLEGLTREEIAEEMRRAGFPETAAMDMEDVVIWADVIE